MPEIPQTQPVIWALVGAVVGAVLVAIARMMVAERRPERAAVEYGAGDGRPSAPLLTIAGAGYRATKSLAHRGRAPRSQTRLAADPWIGQMGLLRERVVPAASSRGFCDYPTARVGDLEKL
jgi:hypothetical protein